MVKAARETGLSSESALNHLQVDQTDAGPLAPLTFKLPLLMSTYRASESFSSFKFSSNKKGHRARHATETLGPLSHSGWQAIIPETQCAETHTGHRDSDGHRVGGPGPGYPYRDTGIFQRSGTRARKIEHGLAPQHAGPPTRTHPVFRAAGDSEPVTLTRRGARTPLTWLGSSGPFGPQLLHQKQRFGRTYPRTPF